MDFDNYLTAKLKELNVDETVFKPYIVGILEGEEDDDEKKIAISEILTELDNDEAVREIIEKWNLSHMTNDKPETKNKIIDVEEQLTKLLEKQKIQTTVQKQYTQEELKIREQILAQYSQTTIREDEEDDDIGPEKKEKITDDDDLVRNTNKADVAAAVRAKREQAKLESQMKKDKDKEDLKKQKQLKEEKKEKRKTVKSEKRR